MAITLKFPEEPELRARITVFGVGGAGGNAVNNMIIKQLPGVDFITANTDAQALANSQAPRSIQLGTGVTRGLGAGSKPEVGLHAAEETMEEIASHLEGCHMCFITAGMGGGTGTGAAPVVARIAREMGILTVGVVTKPFHFEGTRRMKVAEAGIDAMQQVVDTLIVIPNQNLFQVASERTTFVEAFQMADDVLYQGVQGVTDLMVRPGMINLDFADVRSVMEEMGKAMMGTGEAEGETRAIDAAEKAIANPLLDEVSLKGAKGVLINITGGHDLTLFEMDEAANRIKEEVDPNAMIKFGSAIDPDLQGRMRVSVVATGIDAESMPAREPMEATLRRRPVATDPDMLAAVRGQRRPEPAAAGLRAEAEEDEDAAGHEDAAPVPAPAVARSAAASGARPEPRPELRPESRPNPRPDPRMAEARMTPEFRPAGEPRPAEQRPTGALPPEAQPARREEQSYATAPSPADIRARAEEVRQRALAARARRDEERRAAAPHPVAALDDEPARLDIHEATLERRVADARMTASPQPARRPAEDPFAPRPRAEPEPESRPAARSGLFTINKLINRVAGHGPSHGSSAGSSHGGSGGGGEERPQRAERRDPPDFDDGGDIPAFLRRQAN